MIHLHNRTVSPLRWQELALITLVVTVLLAGPAWTAITSPFTYVDDHEFVRFTQRDNRASLWQVSVVDEINRGRFRPVYYALRMLQCITFGANPLAQHIYTMTLGILTVIFFYVSMRLFQFSPIPVLAPTLLLALNRHSPTWVRCGPAETPGIFLLCLGLLFLAAYHKTGRRFLRYGYLLVIFLMSMTKETFFAVYPLMALALFITGADRDRLSLIQWARNNPVVVLLSVLLFLTPAFGIGMAIHTLGGTYNYGTPQSHFDIAANNLLRYLLWTPFLLVIAVYFLTPQSQQYSQRTHILLITLIFLWISSQLLVNKDRSLSAYDFLPGVIVFLIVTVPLLESIAWSSARWLYATSLGAFACMATLFLVLHYCYSTKFAAEAIAYEKVLQTVQRTQPNTLAVLGTPGDSIEFIAATHIFLNARKCPVPLSFIRCDEPPLSSGTGDFDDGLMTSIHNQYTTYDGRHFAQHNPPEMIVLPQAIHKDHMPSLFSDDRYSVKAIAEPYLQTHLKRMQCNWNNRIFFLFTLKHPTVRD